MRHASIQPRDHVTIVIRLHDGVDAIGLFPILFACHWFISLTDFAAETDTTFSRLRSLAIADRYRVATVPCGDSVTSATSRNVNPP